MNVYICKAGLPSPRSLDARKPRTKNLEPKSNLHEIDDVGIWGGRSGEITNTRVDATAAEGTFSFVATARDTAKTVKVSEGTFRILLTRQYEGVPVAKVADPGDFRIQPYSRR